MAAEEEETVDILNGNKPDASEDNVPDEQEEEREERKSDNEQVSELDPSLLSEAKSRDKEQNQLLDNNNNMQQSQGLGQGQGIVLNDNIITTDGGTLSYFGDDDHNKLNIRIIDTEIIKATILKHTSFIIESSLNIKNNYTVSRRYNDFKWLHNVLSIEYLCIFIPPIPPSSNASNILQKFDKDFVSQRRYDLERFLNRIFNNQLLAKSQSFEIFLTQQSRSRFEEQQKEIKVCTKQ